MTIDALLYLPTREVMTKERSSKITLPMKRLSQGINWGRGSYLWTPGWSHLKAYRTREEKGCERKMRGQDTDARERLARKELSQLRHGVLSSTVREYFCEKPVFRRVKHLCDLSLIFFLPSICKSEFRAKICPFARRNSLQGIYGNDDSKASTSTTQLVE